MKKIFTALFLVGMIVPGVYAEELAPLSKPEGFYRLNNAAFGEYLKADSRYEFGFTLSGASDAGTVFEIQTDALWSMNEELEKIQALLDEGKITQDQYMTMFMSLMNQSWKGGLYPVRGFRTQDVDYVDMINKLPEYADRAIETFLNEDVDEIYENYREMLTLLCVFATDIINPGDLENIDSFRKWAENYVTRWRAVTDFSMFLSRVYDTPEDPEAPAIPTGEYYVVFKTPPYVGNMEKAQLYINSIIRQNDEKADTMDIWREAKHYMLDEIAKDYPEASPAYEFVHELLGDSRMNMLYSIGETENGKLKIQPLPDAFNSQNISFTAEDLARCTWMFEEVDAKAPLLIKPDIEMRDAEGLYYTTLYTGFPYQLSPGMKAYYATSVSPEDGVAVIEQILGDKVPAATPVILSTEFSEMDDNKIVPISEKIAEIEGNVLSGTYFGFENEGHSTLLRVGNETLLFDRMIDRIPQNSAYGYIEKSSVSFVTVPNGEVKVYDLFGREVKDPGAKGIFIVNGRKIVRM